MIVNEVFLSLQGEGVRAGTVNVFIRFSGCNLRCSRESEGFDCDTEFVSGREMGPEELVAEVQRVAGECRAVIFTGGEPALQLKAGLVFRLRELGFYTAIETNGTRELDTVPDWLTVSPKTAEHTIRLKYADEVKYVRRVGQGIPRPALEATHKLLSPAFQADGTLLAEDLEWCIRLVREHPEWRLSVQQHKAWRVR